MDQEKLRAWEAKCIQEEPPECTASCPIHVDARLFLKEMAAGDLEAAFKVLAKTMPFPRILSRICDHPCEARCKRGEVDEPVAIGLLERRCVESAAGKGRMQPLPSRGHRIAVIGGGFAGLCAAWDLLKKGFPVTIFEGSGRLGGSLWNFPENLLPAGVIAEEVAVLETLRAEVRLDEVIDAELFGKICSEFEAVFVDRESCRDLLPGLANGAGEITACSASGATDCAGVYAGGGTGITGSYSPVSEALQGRKGALSIERFVQGVQMAAGRENEGPYETRLHTNVSAISPRPRVVPHHPEAGFTAEEAALEGGRCLQCECMECVKSCLFLERYQGYPKKYARQIFNNEKVIFGAAHTKNQFVNSCSNCGLCETACPNDFHMGELCIEARRTMNQENFMPAAFHEFALNDLAHSSGDAFALARHAAGTAKSDWLYFPSCQLCATAPAEVLASYRFLRERLTGGVGILLGCCGAPAYWAGRADLFEESMAAVRRQWEELGKPSVITACSSCESLFTEHLPEISLLSLWSVLEETGFPVAATGKGAGGAVAVADPCQTRNDPETRQSVRRIAQALGLSVHELGADDGVKPECCGYGGLVFQANPKLAHDLLEHRVKPPGECAPPSSKPFAPPGGWHRTHLQEGRDTVYYTAAVSPHDYLAYCAMCRDRLASAGKRVSHLIEHLFPTVPEEDPAARGWISWSERRRNRALVKEAVLRDLGETQAQSQEEYQKTVLLIAPEVLRTIDERRILEDDVKRVVHRAELTGKRLQNRRTGGYLGYHQLGTVTFWVDYTPGPDGYTVHNAYCHRMTIVGVKK